ncbi:hypothetical protein U1Q18_039205 [Sarracenia purpurea var. burkii]
MYGPNNRRRKAQLEVLKWHWEKKTTRRELTRDEMSYSQVVRGSHSVDSKQRWVEGNMEQKKPLTVTTSDIYVSWLECCMVYIEGVPLHCWNDDTFRKFGVCLGTGGSNGTLLNGTLFAADSTFGIAVAAFP